MDIPTTFNDDGTITMMLSAKQYTEIVTIVQRYKTNLAKTRNRRALKKQRDIEYLEEYIRAGGILT